MCFSCTLLTKMSLYAQFFYWILLKIVIFSLFFFVELDLNLEKAHFNKFWDRLLNLSFMCIIEFWHQLIFFGYFWNHCTYCLVFDVQRLEIWNDVEKLEIWTRNVISDGNWIKISTDYFWYYYLILFDIVCRFLGQRHCYSRVGFAVAVRKLVPGS
jgi:hypothetical protein